LGPRRAVAGSIVLRGPKAPRLAGRLSSNVRPHELEAEAHSRSWLCIRPPKGEDEVADVSRAGVRTNGNQASGGIRSE
jgi:hypothetical protein